MRGRFIYICRTDTDGPEQGKYVQPSRRVFPTRQVAEYRAKGVAPGRKPVVVELPEPVVVDDDYYPVKESEEV